METALLTGLAVSGLAWLYLAGFHYRFWRSDQVLPETTGGVEKWPFVVAVIPARNEEAVLGATLKTVAGQTYQGRLEIIVVNDNSTDATSEIAKAVRGVTVLNAEPLIPGWAGKLWAMRQGVALAGKKFKGADFFWFTDADIAHDPDVLAGLVKAARLDRRNMVSQMVFLHCRSFWEKAFVPAFIYFFEMLYPFDAANSDKSKLSGAAGGCILIETTWLEKIGGIERIKSALIDDCAMAAAVKGGGGRIWLGFGLKSRSVRPYTFNDFWTTVARTAFTQLKNSTLLLIGTIVAMTLMFLIPPGLFLYGAFSGNLILAAPAGVLWLVMAGLFAPTLRLYRLSPVRGLALPFVALLYMAMTVDSAFRHWRGTGGRWKDRSYDFTE